MQKEIKKNTLDELSKELLEIIKDIKEPFYKLDIIVPSKRIEEYFKAYWLKNSDDVLMNINFLTLKDALFNIFNNNKYIKINNETRKLLLLKILTSPSFKLPEIIKNYIYDKNNAIDDNKLYDLINELSKLFNEYEEDNFIIKGYQKEIYDLLMEEAKKYNITSLYYLFNNLNKEIIKDNNYILFGFNKFNKLEEDILSILSKDNDIAIYSLKTKDEINTPYSIISAPSKIREIEGVHSIICELIKDKDVKYSDFLVVAPSIYEYKNEIKRVFYSDDESYLSIPYSINYFNKEDSLLTSGLNKLLEIYNKGFFTRLDLYELINNTDIKRTRNISEEDIDNIKTLLMDLEIYRNTDFFDDWEYSKKRIILSKISSLNEENHIISLNNKDYIPYSNIFSDDEFIIKYVSLINDLKKWLEFKNNKNSLDESTINDIENELSKWFSYKDDNGMDDSFYFKKLKDEIFLIKKLDILNNHLDFKTLMYLLIDNSKSINMIKGDLFKNGISFIDFDKNLILSSKYIFFLGCSSTNFPLIKNQSELDLREKEIDLREKEAFYLLKQNASKHFYISYVSLNLKTDEKYYISSYALPLYNEKEEIKINIDETRSYKELFTKREEKNKEYFLSLLKDELVKTNINDDKNKKDELQYNHKNDLTISISNMNHYLKEPLQYKFEKLVGKEEDDSSFDDEYEKYENYNGINFWKLKRNLIKELLEKEVILDLETLEYLSNLDSSTYDESLLPISFKEVYKKFNLQYNLNNKESDFNLLSFAFLYLTCYKAKEFIASTLIDKDDYEIIRLSDLFLKYKDEDIRITCDRDIVIKRINNNFTYMDLDNEIGDEKTQFNAKIDKFFYLYIASLVDIALINDEEIYHIKLIRNRYLLHREYDLTSEIAKEYLLKIYESMNNYSSNFLMPWNLLSAINSVKDYDDFIEKATGNFSTTRKYFEGNKYFDKDKDLGYTEDNFLNEFKENQKEIKRLILFLNFKEDEDE